MAFGLLYWPQDLQMFVNEAHAATTSASDIDRDLFEACWAGGLSDWESAPVAPEFLGEDEFTLIVVIDAGLSKAEFAELLDRMAEPDRGFLATIARDLRLTAVEPWGE